MRFGNDYRGNRDYGNDYGNHRDDHGCYKDLVRLSQEITAIITEIGVMITKEYIDDYEYCRGYHGDYVY